MLANGGDIFGFFCYAETVIEGIVMFTLDEDFLSSLGLATMPPEEKKEFLQYVYDKLEYQVGIELSRSLTDAQLEEFEELMEDENQAKALQWLEKNCPHYKQVVAAELKKIKQEIIENKDKLVES